MKVTNQNGFFFDSERCVQCRTCEVACLSIHSIHQGVKWRRVIEIWFGEFPDVTRKFFSLSCMHCRKPACVEVCPTGAIEKRAEDGIVVVDRDKCNGCQECLSACPYDIPQFGSDGTMQKCDFCLELGKEPVCAAHCPTGALHYGSIDKSPELTSGKIAEKLSGLTEPSLIVLHKPGINIILNTFAR